MGKPIVLAAAISILVAAPAATAHVPADSLIGVGQRVNLAGEPTKTIVFAHGSGAKADGLITIVNQQATGIVFILARVTCLQVEENRALAAGIVVRSTNPIAPVGSLSAVQVTDNGLADTNLNFHQITSWPANECAFIDAPERPITGNFIVTDN